MNLMLNYMHTCNGSENLSISAIIHGIICGVYVHLESIMAAPKYWRINFPSGLVATGEWLPLPQPVGEMGGGPIVLSSHATPVPITTGCEVGRVKKFSHAIIFTFSVNCSHFYHFYASGSTILGTNASC